MKASRWRSGFIALYALVGALFLIATVSSLESRDIYGAVASSFALATAGCTAIDPSLPGCEPTLGDASGSDAEGSVDGTEQNGITFPRSVFVVATINGTTYVGWATYSYSGAWYGTYNWSGENFAGGMAGGMLTIDRIDAVILSETGEITIDDYTVEWTSGPFIG